MLHLRIVAPAGLGPAVLDALRGDPAVATLTVQRGAAVDPIGDVIEADVAREAVNGVIDRLRQTGVEQTGSITLTTPASWLSRRGVEAEVRTPGAPSDAVVWNDVVQKAYDETSITWTFLSFMVLATLLASIAIVLDSPILIIGAMVLGPEFGAIASLGISLVRRRPTLLRRALRSLAVGFGVALIITTLLALIARAAGWVTAEQLIGPRPGTDFIYHPDPWSLVVAVLAGAAGVLSMTSSRSSGLVGVFISVTTIPAAGNLALALAFLEGPEIIGSGLQLVINITGMGLAGWATLAVQQSVWRRLSDRRSRGQAEGD